MIHAVAETNRAQCFVGRCSALARIDPGEDHGQLTVLPGSSRRNQVKRLKNDADCREPIESQIIARHCGQVLSSDKDMA